MAAEQCRKRQGDQDRLPERDVVFGEQVKADIRPDHQKLALSQVEGAGGLVDNDEAGRHQRINAADHEAVDKELQEKGHVHSGYSVRLF